MAKKNQTEEKGAESQEPEVQETTENSESKTQISQLRYVGKTIKHFDHNGKMYQIMPNSVYLNLPADAEQVKRLIENKELVEV
jgi:hypothetical protein